jgi:hypothetical protein
VTIKEITRQPHLAEAVYHIRKAQGELAAADLGTSPTFYALTRSRMTIEHKLTGKHLKNCVCSRCLMEWMKDISRKAQDQAFVEGGK